MFSSILLAGLLTASTFASPIEIPAALRPRGEREFCDAKVFNDEPPNDYCYQFCDLKVNNIVAGKPIQVSEDSRCPADGPDGGCLVTILNQAAVEVSSTDSHSTADTTTVEAGVELFNVRLGVSVSHMVESSHASTHGITTTKASTSYLYIPKGKSGHVVFFPFYEEHCGLGSALRKPNLQDDHDFDCNPDYNILIKHEGRTEIRGMQYDYDGIHPGDIYNYEEKCIQLPMTLVNGNAKGMYQVCDSDNTDNACKECIDCDPNA
ncbi:hypothetical protein VE03_06622 [Pseudogymnoascus sp. 23342-1-I1]|nr:hypothetical protein VE03_06622 [Pseudogymnoascus sp. 23342-1-I1]